MLTKIVVAAAIVGAVLVGATSAEGSAYPCSSAGGAVGATTGSGGGATQVTVYCANGTKEIFTYLD